LFVHISALFLFRQKFAFLSANLFIQAANMEALLIFEITEQDKDNFPFLFHQHTVIRFRWVSTEFGTCIVVSVNGTHVIVEDKMRRFKGECAQFSFNKCPIDTHDGASAKFSTNSHETDNSAVSWTKPVYSKLSEGYYIFMICCTTSLNIFKNPAADRQWRVIPGQIKSKTNPRRPKETVSKTFCQRKYRKFRRARRNRKKNWKSSLVLGYL
jgi:hypothetical protein